MSVNKVRVPKATIDDLSFDSKSRVKPKPYFLIHCDVMEKITEPVAGFIWIYLQSKSRDWEVVKSYIKTKFNLGDKALKDAFAYLARVNLIQYVRPRGQDGKLGKVQIDVMDGNDFIEENQEVTDLSPLSVSTGSKNHPVANHACGKQATTKYRFLPSKEKNNYASQGFKEKRKNFKANQPSFADVESQTTSYHPDSYLKPPKNAKTEEIIGSVFKRFNRPRKIHVQ